MGQSATYLHTANVVVLDVKTVRVSRGKVKARSICQRFGSAIFSDAVPELLDQRQALFNAAPINTK